MLTKRLLPSVLFGLLSSTLALTGCSQVIQTKTEQSVVERTLIPVEAFFDEQAISDVSLSPDGQWIAFLKEFDGVRNIFLVAHDKELSEAFAMTQSNDPIASFQWAETGNELFFTKDEGGNENTQIYHLDFSADNPKTSANAKALTNNSNAQYLLLGQAKAVPSRLVVMSNQDNAKQIDVYHLDILSGDIHRVAENKLAFRQFELNNMGEPVIAVSSNPDNSNTLYINDKGEWKTIFKSKFGESIDVLKYDEVNNQIFVRANIQGRDKQELLRLDLLTNVFHFIHKDPNNQSDVYDVQFNEQAQPIAVSYYGGKLRTYPLNDNFAQHWQKITQYFGNDVEITVKSINEKNQQWQLHVASDVSIGSDHSYNAKAGKFQALLVQEPAIAENLLSKRQSVTYQARDGVMIQAYLTLPKDQEKALPTIILPHGGPWARDYWTLSSGYFNPVAQLLANRGYAVLQPNFRSSTGFGKRFINLGNKNWGTGTMQHDLTDGVNYLIEQGIADKARVGIMGGSYGGYATLAGITFTPDLYKAAVSYVGPSSLITLLEAFPPHYRPYLGQFYSAIGDPLIDADIVDMNARSPINFVDVIKTPLLLVQGANDPRVTKVEADNIARVMEGKNMPVEYILATDEGHGFQKRINKLSYVFAMENFFAKHLGGRKSAEVPPAIAQHLSTLRVDTSKL